MSEQETTKKFNPVILLIIITAIVVAGAYFIAKEKTAGTYESEIDAKYFMHFRDSINDVAAITMITSGQTFNIEKTEAGWVLPDRHNYPVSIDKVRDIVINASELKKLEVKTDDPERLGVLGLDDPKKEGSGEAVQVTFYDANGAVMADFVAGKLRKNGGRTFYARKTDETQSYLVKGEGWLQLDTSPTHWLNHNALNIAKERIEKATFSFAEKQHKSFTAARSHAGARSFRINELGDREIISNTDVTEAAFSLSTLQLVGVLPVEQANFDEEKITTTTFRTFDGLEMAITTTVDESNDTIAKISAKAEGASIEPSVTDQAATINTDLGKWAYVLSEESGKLLTSKFEVLTKAKEKDNTANDNQ